MRDDLSRRAFLMRAGYGAVGAAFMPLLSREGAAFGVRHSLSGSDLDELARLVPELMKESTVPGVAMAVIRDAKVAWHRGFGVRDAKSKALVDEHTIFEAASVSKPVFAYAVMQLWDRGILSIDKPLTSYTPTRILDDPRLDLITARHVLSHTTGFQNFRTRADPLTIQFTPGERYEYSGEGYWYLQTVVTQLVGHVDPTSCGEYEAGLTVCGSDIDRYLKSNVLRPLRMDHSSYEWNSALWRNAARPHDEMGKPLPLSKPTSADAARYAAMGGLRTTALDYANFLIEILAPRAASPFRLATESRQEMLSPQVQVDDANEWALGWELHRNPRGTLIQHEGGQTGFLAFAAASTDRQTGYVILTNGANGWKVFFNERFVALVNRILLG
jgi:CubicO group peptidase (beta-lactamase class C family)